jgi:hypothetical protein
MSVRIAPTLAFVALASPAWADPPVDASSDEAPPSSVSRKAASIETESKQLGSGHGSSEAATSNASSGERPTAECRQPVEASPSDAASPATSAADPAARLTLTSIGIFLPANEVEAHRPLTMKAWARDFRHALSLREFIETSPLVLAGLKFYLEAEPIAVRQRRESTSQLTVAVAPDRVVVLGAF